MNCRLFYPHYERLSYAFTLPVSGWHCLYCCILEAHDVGKSVSLLLLCSSDSTLVKGELSRDDGQFAFEAIKKGDYLLVASQVGFRKTYSSLVVVRAAMSLLSIDPITVQSETKQLQSVTVSAHKPLSGCR